MSGHITPKRSKQFVEDLIPDRLLEDAVEWITSMMRPEDIFSEVELGEWAEDNGYKKVEEEGRE